MSIQPKLPTAIDHGGEEHEVLYSSGPFEIADYDIDANQWEDLCKAILEPGPGPYPANILCPTCGFRSHDQVIFDHHLCAEVMAAAVDFDQ